MALTKYQVRPSLCDTVDYDFMVNVLRVAPKAVPSGGTFPSCAWEKPGFPDLSRRVVQLDDGNIFRRMKFNLQNRIAVPFTRLVDDSSRTDKKTCSQEAVGLDSSGTSRSRKERKNRITNSSRLNVGGLATHE